MEPLRVTSKYGPRNTGIKGASTFHMGIDLGRDFSKPQTHVLAVGNGTVANNYWNNTRGWVVIIDHGNFKTLYQHLKYKSSIFKGSEIKSGQPIGVMGASTNTIKGMSMHLHMELIVGGLQIDPLPYLKNIKPKKSEQEVEDLTESEVKSIVKEVLAESRKEASAWASKEWQEGQKLGITDGERPQAVPTREQVVSMIVRARK